MRYYKTKINKKMQQIICGNFFRFSVKRKSSLNSSLVKKKQSFLYMYQSKKKKSICMCSYSVLIPYKIVKIVKNILLKQDTAFLLH